MKGNLGNGREMGVAKRGRVVFRVEVSVMSGMDSCIGEWG